MCRINNVGQGESTCNEVNGTILWVPRLLFGQIQHDMPIYIYGPRNILSTHTYGTSYKKVDAVSAQYVCMYGFPTSHSTGTY